MFNENLASKKINALRQTLFSNTSFYGNDLGCGKNVG